MIKKIILRALLSSFFRSIVGATFIVSGIIKGNDSIGFAYKLEEYFQNEALAYRFHEIGWGSFSLEWLIPFSLLLAVFISVFEIVLGFALIVKAKIKTSLFFTFAMLIFFTFLTLHTATCVAGTELVSGGTVLCVDDCGCFGDAMKDSFGRSLTPWESFYKDILLIIFSIPIFILDRKKGLNSLFQDFPSLIFSFVFTFIWSWIFSWYFPMLFLLLLFVIYFLIKKYYSHSILVIFSTALVSTLFVSYTFNNLPLKDYRPYKEGFNFKDNYQEDSQEVNINENTIFAIYEGNTDNNVTNFFVDHPAMLVSSSYKFDNKIDKKLYRKSNYTIKQTITETKYEDIKLLLEEAKNDSIDVMHICNWSDMSIWKEIINENETYYYGDGDIGKIIIRSDPGLLLFKNGVLIKKWHYNNIPDIEEVQNLLK